MKMAIVLLVLAGCDPVSLGTLPVSDVPTNVLCTVATLVEGPEVSILERVGVDLGTVVIRPSRSYVSYEQVLKEASAQAALAGGTHYVMVQGSSSEVSPVLGEEILKEYPTATFEVYRVESSKWKELPVYMQPECRGVFRAKGT